MIPQDLQKELDALIKNYARDLPGEIRLIENLWEHFLKSNHSDDLKKVHLKLHTLAGSAPSFGFKKVGDGARWLEGQLGNCLEKGISLTEKEQQTITQGIKDLAVI